MTDEDEDIQPDDAEDQPDNQHDQLDDSGVGDGNYVVKPGDCLSKIAAAFGFDWQALWNLPENAELKHQRKDPNVLYPGDRLFVPERQLKQLDAATDQLHTYRLKGTPAKVRLRFLEDGEPRAGESYILMIDGALRSGTLDSNGQLEERIPPDADSVTIIIADENPIALKLGSVDPVNTISGVQGRLSNLGFPPGPIDNKMGPKTRTAIRRFQDKYDLAISGKADDATQAKLVELHGC